jgi:hypothetical protein
LKRTTLHNVGSRISISESERQLFDGRSDCNTYASLVFLAIANHRLAARFDADCSASLPKFLACSSTAQACDLLPPSTSTIQNLSYKYKIMIGASWQLSRCKPTNQMSAQLRGMLCTTRLLARSPVLAAAAPPALSTMVRQGMTTTLFRGKM